MNIRRFLGKCISANYIIRAKIYPSFSQAGEDQLVRYLFNALKISQPSFLDIGANHPVIGNNTYYFYLRGSRGVVIEPDPGFYALIRKKRPYDTVLQVGIGGNEASGAELYIFPHPYSGWNTFSREEALSRQQESGISFTRTEKVPLMTIDSVMQKYFNPHPNFLSIDVEGLDLAILQSIDFSRWKPEVICVETITFSTHNEEVKVNEIIDFLLGKGYFIFGDTHINTIFCRKDIYKAATP